MSGENVLYNAMRDVPTGTISRLDPWIRNSACEPEEDSTGDFDTTTILTNRYMFFWKEVQVGDAWQ